MTDVNTETNNIAQAERTQEETPSAAAAIEAANKDAAEAKAPDGSGDAGAVEKNDEPKTTNAAGSDAEKSTTTTTTTTATAAAEKDDDHRSEAVETDARGWRIVQRGVAGVVRRWNLRGGFGFVQRDDTREELFVHHSAVVRAANARNRPRRVLERSLLPGQQIEFDVVDGPKGVQAANVTGPESAPVPALKLCKFHRTGAGGSERPQRRVASPRGRRDKPADGKEPPKEKIVDKEPKSKAGAKEKPSDKEQKPAENGAAKEPAAAANDGEKRAANGKKRSRKAKRNRGRTARPKKDTTETAAANDDDADDAAKDDVEPPTPQPEAVDAQQIAAAAAVGAE